MTDGAWETAAQDTSDALGFYGRLDFYNWQNTRKPYQVKRRFKTLLKRATA